MGAPYYFYSKLGIEMEIISLGEDIDLWTDDDISSVEDF